MKSKVIPANRLVKQWLKRVSIAEGKLALGRKLSSSEFEDVNLFRVLYGKPMKIRKF